MEAIIVMGLLFALSLPLERIPSIKLHSYFQPIIVLSVLPLCIAGVIFGVLLHGHGEPMSFPGCD